MHQNPSSLNSLNDESLFKYKIRQLAVTAFLDKAVTNYRGIFAQQPSLRSHSKPAHHLHILVHILQETVMMMTMGAKKNQALTIY